MGSMVGVMQPAIREVALQMNQHAFNQQLGRGASNQMYQPPSNPFSYDPYTAARRPNYMTFGPNQQFYQPIYQPRYEQQFRTMDQMYQMPTYTRPLTPQPMQSQYRPIPFMSQTQIEAQQRAAVAAAAAAAPPSYDYGGGYGDAGFGGFGGGFGGGAGDSGGYSGPGSVGAEGATASGGMGPGDGAGDGGAGASGAASGDSGGATSGEGLGRGGYIRRPIYGGIDSLLRK